LRTTRNPQLATLNIKNTLKNRFKILDTNSIL
jgi:hypothetical protein